ncbi:MAG TPA: Ppx/GppA phosphatase family protein [Thermoplasmata archaeon]|nr:Ppx/GppA phosphatase family protein [Thermoplasmata archaeon]
MPSRASEGRESRPYAVVDVGSNTARLAVFEVTDAGGLRASFESKEVPRLGEGVGPDRSLTDGALRRGVESLARFRRRLAAIGDPPAIAVATSAVRDAPNGSEFVARVRTATGFSLRVLSGDEEARYAYLGVAGAWDLHADTIVDLGGGSLQAARTRAGAVEIAGSAPLGALRLTESFFEHDPPKRREVEDLRRHAREHLRRLPGAGALRGRLFGVGGTIRCLARVAVDLTTYPLERVHGYPLTRGNLARVERLLLGLDADERRGIPGVGGHRADVIVAGSVVVDELMRRTGASEIVVSATGIREGIALEHAGVRVPAPSETLAWRSMTAEANALGFSLPHGEAVRTVALELFDALAPRFGWKSSERLTLSVAAWMHDVGWTIDPWRHAKHSAYVLRHAAIHGLTHREVAMASIVAYLHEGDPFPPAWKESFRPLLDDRDLETARRLGALVFFAEALDGARPGIWIPRGSDRLVLTPESGRGARPSERTVQRLRKPTRRALGLEVELDGR